jgi:hypothetical protein
MNYLTDQGHGAYRRLKAPATDYLINKDRRASAQQDEIQHLASLMEPKLAHAILNAFDKQGANLDVKAIIAALERGDMAAILKLLADDAFDVDMGPAKDGLQAGVKAGGLLGTDQIVRLTGATFRFNSLNPKLVTWLQTYELGLIRQINAGTKEAIRDKLLTGMVAGSNPKAVARQIKEVVGLTTTQAKAVSNFRKELENFHLKTSAGSWNLGSPIDRVNGTQVFKPGKDGTPTDGIDSRRLRDFRYDKALLKALESGIPLKPEQIDKMVEAYHRKYLIYRSRNIARTEALRTTNQGVAEAWNQAIEQGKVQDSKVRRLWIVSKDERTCAFCAPIPKLNPKLGVKVGQPFNTAKGPIHMPPLHPSCRCTMFMRMYEPSQLTGESQ